MTIMNLLTWRMPGRWPLQPWMERQSRLVRFLVALVAFSAAMLLLVALVPGWAPLRLPALVGGALAFATLVAWRPAMKPALEPETVGTLRKEWPSRRARWVGALRSAVIFFVTSRVVGLLLFDEPLRARLGPAVLGSVLFGLFVAFWRPVRQAPGESRSPGA